MHDLVGQVKVVKTGFALELGNQKLGGVPGRSGVGRGKCGLLAEIFRDMGRLGLFFSAPSRGGPLRLLREGLPLLGDGKIVGFSPTGDNFSQFVTEAIDDFSYQSILSVKMTHYAGVADSCPGEMAYLGEKAKDFSAGNLRENMPVQTVYEAFSGRSRMNGHGKKRAGEQVG